MLCDCLLTDRKTLGSENPTEIEMKLKLGEKSLKKNFKLIPKAIMISSTER